jgi:hypothetical protein
MVLREVGNVMDVSPLHRENAKLEMVLKEFGKSMDVNAIQEAYLQFFFYQLFTS